MDELLSLVIIGIALSMDAFSVALGIGTLSIEKKKNFHISLCVGAFHFIMPLLGLLIGNHIVQTLHIKAHFLMAGVFLLIAFEMLKETFSKEDTKINLNFFGIIGFALTVSLDSFSSGIALGALTTNIFLASIIFSITSFSFTFLGLTIGKYSKEKLGKIATLIGAILLIILAIRYFAM